MENIGVEIVGGLEVEVTQVQVVDSLDGGRYFEQLIELVNEIETLNLRLGKSNTSAMLIPLCDLKKQMLLHCKELLQGPGHPILLELYFDVISLDIAIAALLLNVENIECLLEGD